MVIHINVARRGIIDFKVLIFKYQSEFNMLKVEVNMLIQVIFVPVCD